MPSQGEVLRAAKELGNWFTLSQLREHFGMHHLKGSSHLSARIKKLCEYGYLVKFKAPGGRKIYIVRPEHWDITKADEILFLAKQSTQRRRWYDPEILAKVNNALWDEFQSAYTVAKRTGIEVRTAKRYLEHLVEKGIIFKFQINGVDYYTLYSPQQNFRNVLTLFSTS